MIEVSTIWRVNIPELLGLFDFGLDDLGVDGAGRAYVADGVNGSVYRFGLGGAVEQTFDAIRPTNLNGMDAALCLSVADDSSFCAADPGSERVVRYDALGQAVGEFAAPGILALCRAPDEAIYALVCSENGEHIDCYDSLGSRLESLCAPRRSRARLVPELVAIDADRVGRAYLSYGMPPYRIWRVSRSSGNADEAEASCVPSDLDGWGRVLDHPEDALLISDLTFNRSGSILWVLLAMRDSGRQVLDAFSDSGDFLGSAALPHMDNLCSGVCAAADGSLYLLDSSDGDLVRIAVALP